MNSEKISALFTDFYELTMAQGYWKTGKNGRAVFEMFFRRHPFGGGFSIFAGLETLLENLSGFVFSKNDIEYLRGLNFFEDGFLDYLKDFRFTGTLYAMDEGSVIFPQEPLVRIDGGLIECQIIEGIVLNTINFQSLIATKTARVVLAASGGGIMEFGMRRAQGPDGALQASRASYIGGAAGTSNVLAGKKYGIKVMGTMAHSWVMSFGSEEEAFRTYANLYPVHPIFLIDTYDTLKSGVLNAIKVGREISLNGGTFGVRLDSGDMDYLSKEVRKKLDAAGFLNATIAVSNDLDENIITTLVNHKAPINSWGVGTQMVTGGGDPAFTGVYKLMALEKDGKLTPSIKFSDNPEKTTNPGVKQVWRIFGDCGPAADILALDENYHAESTGKPKIGTSPSFWHPCADYRHFNQLIEKEPVAMLKKYMENGRQICTNPTLDEIQKRCISELASFDPSFKRLLNPHIYKVAITERLREQKLNLIKNYLGDL
ncbi:nicotinate phosphoribosyltransferase [Spirochaetia bacterium]|nr:nicotinate phosphoribosyltransferase [Spirochaetia bacterium]